MSFYIKFLLSRLKSFSIYHAFILLSVSYVAIAGGATIGYNVFGQYIPGAYVILTLFQLFIKSGCEKVHAEWLIYWHSFKRLNLCRMGRPSWRSCIEEFFWTSTWNNETKTGWCTISAQLRISWRIFSFVKPHWMYKEIGQWRLKICTSEIM